MDKLQPPTPHPRDFSHTGDFGQVGVGSITITLKDDLSVHLRTHGVMENAHFLEMATGYLRQYTDTMWQSTWKAHEKEDVE